MIIYQAVVFTGSCSSLERKQEIDQLGRNIPWMRYMEWHSGDSKTWVGTYLLTDSDRYSLYVHTSHLVDLGNWKRYELTSPTPNIHDVLLYRVNTADAHYGVSHPKYNGVLI